MSEMNLTNNQKTVTEMVPADPITIQKLQEIGQAELRLADGKGRTIEGIFRKGDARASATYSVASLLGMKDLVPQAKQLSLRDQAGNMSEGSFAKPLAGTMADHPGKELAGVGEKALFGASPKALEQISDLQVLDYLCGNPGRDGSQIAYTFDAEQKLSGIQAQAGEASFGADGQMVQPGQMGIMRKETARKVLRLKPEKLEQALEGKASPEEISSACERLGQLQEKIRESRKALPDDDTIELPYIRELEDKEFETLDASLMTDMKAPNLFQKVQQVLPVIGYNASMGKAAIEPGKEAGRLSAGGVYGQIGQADELLRSLDGQDPNEESLGMKNAVLEYRDLEQGVLERMNRSAKQEQMGEASAKTAYEKNVTIWDADKMNRSLHQIRNEANQYLQNKTNQLRENDKQPDEAEKGQMEAARKLIGFADQGLGLSVAERETLERNDRRAAAQSERLAAEQESRGRDMQKTEGPVLG